MDNHTRIIMRFSNQRSKIKNIVQKYWHLLYLISNIGRFVSQTPQITDELGPLEIISFIVSTKGKRDRIYANIKVHILVGDVITVDTYRHVPPPYYQMDICSRHNITPILKFVGLFISWSVTVVHFMLTRPRLSSGGGFIHIHSMQTCNPDLSLGRHVKMLHGGVFPRVEFFALDRVHPSLRGGDWNKLLLQRELRWIHQLKAAIFPGLNEAVNYKPFLEGFASGGMEKWSFPISIPFFGISQDSCLHSTSYYGYCSPFSLVFMHFCTLSVDVLGIDINQCVYLFILFFLTPRGSCVGRSQAHEVIPHTTPPTLP